MKKKPLAIFVYSQVFQLLTPGLVGVAHAANLISHSHSQRKKENESSQYSSELAQDLVTIGESQQNAAPILASSYATGALNHYLNQYGHASAAINFDSKGNVSSADINFLRTLSDKKDNVLFYQLSYHQPTERKIFSAGIGDRHYFDNDTYMLGANAFFDGDTRGNLRGSIGGEFAVKNAYLSANVYEPLSNWRSSRYLSFYDVRPARGFDVRFKGYLPSYPELSANLAYSKYYGNVGIFDANTRENNPSLFTYGVSYRPMQILSFQVNRQQTLGGDDQTQFGLTDRKSVV